MSVRVKETEEHLEQFVSQLAAYGQVTIGKRFWETRALDLTEIAKLVRKGISGHAADSREVSMKQNSQELTTYLPASVVAAIYQVAQSIQEEAFFEWVSLPEQPESDPFKEWRLFIQEKLEARMGIPPSELETKRSSPCICIGPPSRNCPQHGSDE